ncbi:MAG: fdhC [Verrucomicrobiales bacterium]|nr:fdhC [Verrucomicrobiales bacterium]
MRFNSFFLFLSCSGVLIAILSLSQPLWQPAVKADAAPFSAPDPIARGKYLVATAGCNDCHTPGFMQMGTKVPESEWLKGVPVGWQGPWGTTYGSNLRQHLAAFPEAEVWIRMVRSREGLPPMPWASLHAMTDGDLTALHAYIRSLPVTGSVMPPALPPGTAPATPYMVMEPVMPGPPKAVSTEQEIPLQK